MTEPLRNYGDHSGATAVYVVQAPQWHRAFGVTGALVGKTEKVSFSSGSESRDITRRADLLRKRVPSRRGGVCKDL